MGERLSVGLPSLIIAISGESARFGRILCTKRFALLHGKISNGFN